MRSLIAAILLCVVLGKPTPSSAQDSPTSVKFTGMASVDDGRVTRFDGANHHGRVATGQRYSSSLLAVAHRTLPLKSYVAISYRNKTVIAVVNDRGPCLSAHCRMNAPKRVRERVLDMTPAVARALSFPGLGRVSFWSVAAPTKLSSR